MPDAFSRDSAARDLVVLDMDGVLLHLELQTERVRAEVSRLLGREARPLVRTLEEVCDLEVAKDPARGQLLRQAAWAIIDAEEQRAAGCCRPAAGLAGFLRALQVCELALFSNNSAGAVAAALERIGVERSRFVAIEARSGSRGIKPAAGPLISIVEAMERAPARVFIVGDHPADMASATAAAPALSARGVEQVIPIGLYGGEIERAVALERAGAWFLAADLGEAATLATTGRAPFGLSLVLLAYDEEALIGQAIEEARRFGQAFLARHEIVVVDDGSSDATARRAAENDRGDVRLVRHERNQGMGAAMRDGYRVATMDYMAPLPADRQVRPASLAPLLALAGPDQVVLTSYQAPPSGHSRALVSLVFRLLVRHLGGLDVDFAGTYLFHRRFLPLLDDPRITSDTFLLSFELLQLMAEAGGSFCQVPIRGFPRQVGTSREFSTRRMVKMVGEIARHRAACLVAPDGSSVLEKPAGGGRASRRADDAQK